MQPSRRVAAATQRARILGCRRDLALVGFALVTFVGTRARACENRRLARSGGEPLAAKRRAKPLTFRQAAARTCDALRPRWRNHKHAKDWMVALERHAHPLIGNMNVDRIRREDGLRVLTPIWRAPPRDGAARSPADARRIALVLGARLCVGERRGGGIDGALPRLPAVKQHFRPPPYSEVAATLEKRWRRRGRAKRRNSASGS